MNLFINVHQIKLQTQALLTANGRLEEKLKVLEDMKSAVKSDHLLHTICSEIATEIHFTSHMNNVLEKFSARRIEQDEELEALRVELKKMYEECQSLTADKSDSLIKLNKNSDMLAACEKELACLKKINAALISSSQKLETKTHDLNRTTFPVVSHLK